MVLLANILLPGLVMKWTIENINTRFEKLLRNDDLLHKKENEIRAYQERLLTRVDECQELVLSQSDICQRQLYTSIAFIVVVATIIVSPWGARVKTISYLPFPYLHLHTSSLFLVPGLPLGIVLRPTMNGDYFRCLF